MLHTHAMFAVIFEVEPKSERWDDYLRHAAALRPELVKIDGFLDNRRFASRRRPGTLLSLSYWRDEAALIRWRAHELHHQAQQAGRDSVFRDYRLRVGPVVRDTDAPLVEAPPLEAPDAGQIRAASVIEAPASAAPPDAPGMEGWDAFDGVTVAGTTLLLLSWRNSAAMHAWAPAGGARRTDVAIRRDYGMGDRREAPLRFPPVDR